MTAEAADGTEVNIPIFTDTGDMNLEGDLDNSSFNSNGNDDLVIAAGINITTSNSLGSIQLDATTNGIRALGAVVVDAGANVTINDDFLAADVSDVPQDMTIISGSATTINGKLSAEDIDITAGIGISLGDVSDNEAMFASGSIDINSSSGDFTCLLYTSPSTRDVEE